MIIIKTSFMLNEIRQRSINHYAHWRVISGIVGDNLAGAIELVLSAVGQLQTSALGHTR